MLHHVKVLICSVAALLMGGALSILEAQPLVDGFTPARGEFEIALGQVDERYEDFYIGSDPAPKARSFDEVVAAISTFYGSYGVTDNLEVVLNIPWIRRETTDAPHRTLSGFQDGSVYANQRILTRETRFLGSGYFSVLGGVGLIVPLSDYEPDRLTSLGHHSTDLDAVVTLHQVWRSGWFGTVQVGHLWRLDAPPNAYSTTLRGGWFNARVFTSFWWQWQDSTSGTDIGQGPFSTNEVDSQVVGAEIAYRFTPDVSVSAKVTGLVDGRNVDKRRTLSAGLIYRF
jgi:hypothetical protein